GFGRALRERLRDREDEATVKRFRLAPALASAAGVALVALAFTIPAVRVAAQNALDLFRVRSFAAVQIDESRVEQLRKLGNEANEDPAMSAFDKPEGLQKPAPPVDYPPADLAASAAGLAGLRQPSGALPGGLKFVKATVSGEGASRLTVRTEKLRKAVELLGLTDVRIPQQLDGQQITVHMPALVAQQYENGKAELTLVEA